jgi:hypothetical protein
MSEFNPKEGDWILAGDGRFSSRIFLYIGIDGRYVCVHEADEVSYQRGYEEFRVRAWPCAKPLPKKLPEFIQGDPVIVCEKGGRKLIRIVYDVLEDGKIRCYRDGAFKSTPPCSMPITWPNYKPLPNYVYGSRDVFERY